MAFYQTKHKTLEARQHVGPQVVVMHTEKGEQWAKDGDYLVGDQPGAVEVVAKTVFEDQWEEVPQDPQDHPA